MRDRRRENSKYLILSKDEIIDVYFDEIKNGRFIPRSIHVDLESGTLDAIRASPY